MLKQVYIAGPLFTQGDRWFLEKIDNELDSRGLTTYLPHRDAGLCPSDGHETEFFYINDVKAIDECEFIVAVLHGTDVDSGTAWEMGYGFAREKPIIAIGEDIRIAGEITNVNLMLSNSSQVCFTFEEFLQKLDEFLKLKRKSYDKA
ncbi:nucleoside 2-deoxyribosyltransferase [Abyssisolibacter fermentans]|uniref:nucleoside 2-deoxyribosyltransferase n=1 Tax=Abyssisolibacter fermentans TaxID=1766203 RepID=UPI00083095B8|nr:nucleoside 2-deoxyribosyltransferase [Abyssisolibacter fermentans]